MAGETIRNAIIGAVLGDIAGSRFEYTPPSRADFELLDAECFFTDDTVLTLATLWALEEGRPFQEAYRRFGRAYPSAGYGEMFRRWLLSDDPRPYGSKGNGAAMRVSPIAQVKFEAGLEVCDRLAVKSASVTHDHPEGVQAARAVTHAIYHALVGAPPEVVLGVAESFGYVWETSVEALRGTYRFSELAEDTLPAVFVCLREGSSFEGCVRDAVRLGGDADTLGAIVGSIAGALWGIPRDLVVQGRSYLPPELADLYDHALCYSVRR
jgi:ADP-ribosylglycohydrolase